MSRNALFNRRARRAIQDLRDADVASLRKPDFGLRIQIDDIPADLFQSFCGRQVGLVENDEVGVLDLRAIKLSEHLVETPIARSVNNRNDRSDVASRAQGGI